MPIEYNGKTYYPVHERLNAMIIETENKYDLTTEIIKREMSGAWVVKATLKIDRGIYTGHACEIDGSNFINDTSALENAETSAIGRALAAAGYCKGCFCSADELATALLNKGITAKKVEPANNTGTQEENKISEAQVNYIKRMIKDLKISQEEENKWLQNGKLSSWDKATSKQAAATIAFLKKKTEAAKNNKPKQPETVSTKDIAEDDFDQDINQ